jgi:hypothetical protein
MASPYTEVLYVESTLYGSARDADVSHPGTRSAGIEMGELCHYPSCQQKIGLTARTGKTNHLCYYHYKQSIGLLAPLQSEDTLPLSGSSCELDHQQKLEVFNALLPYVTEQAKILCSRFGLAIGYQYEDFKQMAALRCWMMIQKGIYSPTMMTSTGTLKPEWFMNQQLKDIARGIVATQQPIGIFMCQIAATHPIEGTKNNPMCDLTESMFWAVVYEYLDRASPMERFIFVRHIYPQHHAPMALRQIAKRFRTNHMSVKRGKDRIFKKLRKKLTAYGGLDFWMTKSYER